MQKTVLALAAALTILGLAGVSILVQSKIPDFNDAIRPCMEREASAPPALRTATCLCYAESARTMAATVYTLVSPASSRETSIRAALNTCRAKAFDANK